MYFFRFVVIGLLATNFLSCRAPLKNTAELVAIDSLLDAQVLMLAKQKTSLRKSATIGDKVSTSMVEMKDSVTWAQELDVFHQLAMVNHPLYIDKYEVVDNVPDTNSNLRILSLSTREKLPITELRVFYQDRKSKIRRVEGSYNESNSIFSGSRNLMLEFQEIQGRLSLMKYTITGGQKMMLGDSVTYQIEGVIDYEYY